MSIDPFDIHPSSSVEVPKNSPIAGLVRTELPTTEVHPTPVSCSSSSEKLDYSGDEDIDWDDVHSASDTSKHSHLAKEEMQVATSGTEPASGETSTVEGILFYLNHHSPFFSPVINNV